MGSIEYGAQQAIQNCLKVKKGENVVIVSDVEREHIAQALYNQVDKAGANAEVYFMENFGTRPDDQAFKGGAGSLAFPDELREALGEADVSIYAAGSQAGELTSFRQPMLKVLIPRVMGKELRHGHMPGINDQLMMEGMSVDYSEVQALNAKLMPIGSQARRGRIVTPAGTDYTVEFQPGKYTWYNCDANLGPDAKIPFSNLPDGEVFGYAVTANGIIVVDGVLGDEFSSKYGDIESTPVSMHVKDGRVLLGTIACANSAIVEDLVFYMQRDENANRIGEWAIGTNLALEQYGFSGEMLQDEKYPGHHVAVGEPCADETGAEWTSVVHMDMVMRKPTITLDDRVVMREGKFTL